MKEKDAKYKVTIDMLMRNENNVFTPVGYQRMLIDVVERHFAFVGADEHTLLAKGISWVLLSMTAEKRSEIKPSESLTARTWISGKSGFTYRREIAVFHEDGTLALVGALFFAMIDLEKRRICRNPELYAKEPEEFGEELLKAESRIKENVSDWETKEILTVRPSWLDAVGHVNNVRYFEMAYDALSEEEREKMEELNRFEMYFIGELHKEEKVILRCKKEKNMVMVAGSREDGKSSFLEKLFFASNEGQREKSF